MTDNKVLPCVECAMVELMQPCEACPNQRGQQPIRYVPPTTQQTEGKDKP